MLLAVACGKFLSELHVSDSSAGVRIVQDDRHAVAGRLGELDVAGYHGAEDLVAEMSFKFLKERSWKPRLDLSCSSKVSLYNPKTQAF